MATDRWLLGPDGTAAAWLGSGSLDRAAVVALAVLAGAGRASAVPPVVTISAPAPEGAAPPAVTSRR